MDTAQALIKLEESGQLATSNTSMPKAHKELPDTLSRRKALKLLADYSEISNSIQVGIPNTQGRGRLFRLFEKIGATSELPSHPNQDKANALTSAYLNDFYQTLYLDNALCPDDVPFDIIIEEFTKALVQNRIKRRGNNQAAICGAFNEWIVRTDTRHNLIRMRDKQYPQAKPKQIGSSSLKRKFDRPEGLNQTMSLQELEQALEQYEMVLGKERTVGGYSEYAERLRRTIAWCKENE